MSLTLYYHPLASFCHKVLIALYEKNIDFGRRVIDLGNDADRAELQAIWPLGKFPVIRDHARKRDVAETTIIIEYLDHFFAGDAPLLPDNWEHALEVRLWDRFFDTHVQGPMQAIVADRLRGANADISAERTTLRTAYAMIDRHLASSRTWISSAGFGMADCAAAPALFYASTIEPFPHETGHLAGYFDRIAQRPSFRKVIEEARPYFPMYPFSESIPQRFLNP